MKPYQERVVAEKERMDEKIDNLHGFLTCNSEAIRMPKSESNLLRIQLNAMKTYYCALAARIEYFHEDEE